MKNYEKYADKIKEYEGDSFCSDFVMPYILKSVSLKSVSCGDVYAWKYAKLAEMKGK